MNNSTKKHRFAKGNEVLIQQIVMNWAIVILLLASVLIETEIHGDYHWFHQITDTGLQNFDFQTKPDIIFYIISRLELFSI